VRRAALAAALAAAWLGGCVADGDQGREVDLSGAATANMKLGVEYMSTGNLAAAKERLERAEQQNPKSPDVQFALAELYSRLQQPKDADKHYRDAISMAPDQLEYVNGYAAFLCINGEVDQALTQFDKLIRNPLYGRQPAAATNAGLCLRDQKRHADSIRYFETAILKQPDWIDAVVQLADVQISLGNPAAARKAVDGYQSMRNSASVLVIGVRAAEADGDCAAAQRYAAKLRTDFPNSREALVLLPQVLQKCTRVASQ
jgi:type IV pilus assembly protein PilF